MEKIETAKNIIINSGGIAKTVDLVAEELSDYDVADPCKKRSCQAHKTWLLPTS